MSVFQNKMLEEPHWPQGISEYTFMEKSLSKKRFILTLSTPLV